jgi:GDP-D-mannose 3',5'-epimerase
MRFVLVFFTLRSCSPEAQKPKMATPNRPLRICIGGGAGFIGSHLARRLKSEGHYVVVADIEENAYWKVGDYCDEFHLLDLRYLENCLKVS